MRDAVISEYLDRLASSDPVPGGGATAGFLGAQSAALVHMVAALTVGKEKYANDEQRNQKALKLSEQFMKEFLDLMQEDVKAYERVAQAYKLSKDTEVQKDIRAEAIQRALNGATLIPMHMMEKGQAIIALAQELVGHSNPNVVSDLAVAAVNGYAAMEAAYWNVVINLSNLNDEKAKAAYEKTTRLLLEVSKEMRDDICQRTREIING